ncbi:hypothetical protein [Pedobacter frigidisoli]|uniref:hypothetical protein n=1 Tax=Pedobacter frigidisoli TaxID=2530455 RepID=UPI00292DC07A|nr:hypothetical protein [Pedobacter frigidisoli]
MEIHLTIIGILLVLLALIHVIFPRYFNWSQELAGLSVINREMIYVHTFFIAFIVFLMGLLCLFSANDLLHTPLGKHICLGLGIFWFLRLLVQFFGYSAVLWKGKRFETGVHVLFTTLWGYFTAIFFFGYFY